MLIAVCVKKCVLPPTLLGVGSVHLCVLEMFIALAIDDGVYRTVAAHSETW